MINLEDKLLVSSKLILKLRNQMKVLDKHIAIYSDLKGKPFSTKAIEKHPVLGDVVVMRSKDNIAQLYISRQDTTFIYNHSPTYQLNVISSLAIFTDMAEKVYHSIFDIVRNLDDIEVMGCINYLNIPTPSMNPSQILFEKFINIPRIDKIHSLNLSFSVSEKDLYLINYTFNKYEQKKLSQKPANPGKLTKEELRNARKIGEGIQLMIDINNRPQLKAGKDVFGKETITGLLIFVRETVLNVEKIFLSEESSS